MRGLAALTFIGGLLVGFMAGGFAPRRELSALRKAHAELEDRLSAMDEPDFLDGFLPTLGAGAVRSATRSSDAANRPLRDAQAATDAPSFSPETSAAGSTSASATRRGLSSASATRRGLSRLSELDAMESAQAARAAASRQALIEQVDLSDEQLQRLDRVFAEVQQQLLGLSGRVVAQVGRDNQDPRELLTLGHEISGLLLQGQQVIDEVIVESGTSPEQVDEKARQVWNHIRIDGVSERVRAAALNMNTNGQPVAGMPAGE